MANEFVLVPQGSGTQRLSDQSLMFARQARAAHTRTAYAKDWAAFELWCRIRHASALPAEPSAIADYLSELAHSAPRQREPGRGRKTSTVSRALSVINQAHKLAGMGEPRRHPLVATVYEGIRRALGISQDEARPILREHLLHLVEALPRAGQHPLGGVRDRAILLVGWIGGFRRSELCDLQRGDIEEHPLGLRIVLRRSMTDQEGKGQDKAIPLGLSERTCPVRALKAWLREAQIQDGHVFRGIDKHGNVGSGRLTDCVIDRIVKSTAKAAGLDVEGLCAHSLRAGVATEAERLGLPGKVTDEQCGWESPAMRMRYARHNLQGRFEALRRLGL